jgi:Polyketide cyclase / dehydrase and lipid transport
MTGDSTAHVGTIPIVRDSVTVHIRATPEQIWPLVSDVTNTKRFAAETFDARWLDGATGPAAGVRFKGHVKRNGWGPVYWSVATIDACEPGREFAFSVDLLPGRPAIRWRYQFEPKGDGTDVTESFELRNDWYLRLYWLVLGWARGKTNVENMRTTLERVKAAAEAG